MPLARLHKPLQIVAGPARAKRGEPGFGGAPLLLFPPFSPPAPVVVLVVATLVVAVVLTPPSPVPP
jgi:hypothetical protein